MASTLGAERVLPLRVPLVAHSSTSCQAIRSIEVEIAVPQPGVLALRYELTGDLSGILVQPTEPVSPGRADGLWKHTCFEAFIRWGRAKGYYELNFSAAGQWAAYRFDDYRAGMTLVELQAAPMITVQRSAGRLELAAVLGQPFAVSAADGAALHLALTAVVEEFDGRLSYWSIHHPQGRPDFHHPDGFAASFEFG